MLCYQCEQTCKPGGCTKVGVCTKDPITAAIQDLIMFGVATRPQFKSEELIQFLFMTLTNTNHNLEALKATCARILTCGNVEFKKHYDSVVVQGKPDCTLSPAYFAKKYGADLNSIVQLGIQGIKGAAAYGDHVFRLVNTMKIVDKELITTCNQMIDLLYYFVFHASMDTALTNLLAVGTANFKLCELLDKYNVQFNGVPQLTAISTTLAPGKCLLITGHDLVDLREVLDLCEKANVNVYTHGEMLPSHMYPELKKYKCLKANYGHAWQLQQTEFELFPGPILFTTNCIMKPRASYIERCYGTGMVGYEGVKHVENGKWDSVIKAALACDGFKDQKHCDEVSAKVQYKVTSTVGLNHRVFDTLAPTLLKMIQDGKIKGFRFVGGCDGASPKRNVFTKLAEDCPKDKIVLTGACGRFKINGLEMGDIDGIPRLLDVGQCNDIYSAIIILVKLAGALKCTVNDLPIELYVSWYEQKAVAQFLTLLSLGVKNIQLGPTAPVCITANVFAILKEKYNVGLIQ